MCHYEFPKNLYDLSDVVVVKYNKTPFFNTFVEIVGLLRLLARTISL